MTGAVIALAGVVGLVVGSFLTVVTSRVPDGLSIVRPRSRCPACSTAIVAIDNLPVFSFIARHGRCRACGVSIPIRYPATEIATSALFALVTARAPELALAPAYCVLSAGLVALSVIDLERFRLPTSIILATAIIGLPLLAAGAVSHHDASGLVRVPISGAIAGAVFWLIVFVSPRGMGLGDVRLASLCGAFLGYLGYRIAAVAILAAFVTAGLLAMGLVATGRAGRKSRIPFGPFLALGSILAVLLGGPIARLWLR